MSSSSLSAPCRAVGTPGRQVRHKRSWHAHEWDDREELLAATFGFLSRNEVPALLKEGSVLTLYCFEVLSWRRNTPLLRHVLEHQGLICSRSPDNRSQDFFRASKPVIGTFLASGGSLRNHMKYKTLQPLREEEIQNLTLLWISFVISIISMFRTHSFGLVVIIYPGILNFSKMSFSPRTDILQQLTKCLA